MATAKVDISDVAAATHYIWAKATKGRSREGEKMNGTKNRGRF